MRRRPGRAWPTLARAVIASALVGSSIAHASLVWGPHRGINCETPSVFYSSRHIGGVPPCCPSDDGVCPGGTACPASGVCAGGVKCVPAATQRPNVILMISDDQGECFYGSAGECRSTETGTPIRAPLTPNLDGLAAAGTIFTVAHNTASWCYPSLNSILTGRYQKSFGGFRSQIAQRYLSVPRVLRQLGRAPGTVVDSFDADASIGGYCTLQGGKFTASSGHDPGFDARVNVGQRSIGRIDCAPNPGGGTPLCGTEMQATYAPFAVDHMRDVFTFMDGMAYKKPGGAPGEFTTQQFFLWYAPRIPHQPLRSPAAIGSYLFGADGRSGFFDLGGLCVGPNCPPTVRAFDESNFGTVREYYASIYLVDANVRELRRFLQATSAPHCIGANGQSRFQETTPQACHGTWATSVTPDPSANTIFLYLSDNGWQLPHSKHNFSENGYRTRLIVFDPRTPFGLPIDAPVQPAAFESPALAHSTDVLPSILGFALGSTPGTQACPESDFDGSPCDGRDFRAQLGSNPGGPAPASLLRRSLCGHETRRPVRPSRGRYLLTGPGTVGRCVLASAPTCLLDLECGAGAFCLGGHCAAHGGQACGACPAGTACIGGRCEAGPPCTDDATCTSVLKAPGLCVAKTTTWCANAPDVACASVSECPACPSANGEDVPCRRVCEPHALKLYDSGTHVDMTDLFLDPDEDNVHENGPISSFFSSESGPYGTTLKRLVCCIDDWWSGDYRIASICQGSCPAELTCNE